MQDNFFTKQLKKNKTILAPMAGVTTLPFRVLCKRYGAGMLVTEMVSAKGLYYKNVKTKTLTDIDKSEHIIGIQIFGNDEEVLSVVTEEYLNESDFDFIDINMGCPMRKVVNNNDGSALLKDLKKAGSVLNAVKSKSKKPVSVKIRIGWDEKNINAVNAAAVLEDNGADMITVHGRTREQLYSGKANWNIIGSVANKVNIPVIGNGDITDYETAVRMLEKYNISGIMVGRASMENPRIFEQINEALKGNTPCEITFKDKITLAKEHFNMIQSYYKENKFVLAEFRKYLYAYAKAIPQAAKVRNMVTESKTKEDIINILDFLEKSSDSVR